MVEGMIHILGKKLKMCFLCFLLQDREHGKISAF